MRELRIHGRGGQGTVIASKLLADALFREGNQVQSFPAFGVERRGAPVETSLKISKTRISDLGPIEQPDVVVVILYSGNDVHEMRDNVWESLDERGMPLRLETIVWMAEDPKMSLLMTAIDREGTLMLDLEFGS